MHYSTLFGNVPSEESFDNHQEVVMKADITRNGQAVAASIEVDVYTMERNGLLEWSGSFPVLHAIQFDDDEYTLELADERSGQILIYGTDIAGASPTKRVRFQGTGPLQ